MRYLIILLVLISTKAESQNTQTDGQTHSLPFIEVAGTASMEVVPDKIIVSVTLSEKNNENDQNNIAKQEQSLQEIIRGMSIPKNHVSLSDATSEILSEKRRDKIVKVSKEYLLELKSANEVSTLLKQLVQADIKETSIRSVEHTKIDSLRKVVRILALQAAKEKAIYLTNSIGEQIGKALEIREISTDNMFGYLQQRSYLSNNLSYSTGRENNDDSLTDFKMMLIKFTYEVKYSLK